MEVDCIVNAANSQLRHGGGVCGAIFAAAGASQLQAACDALGHCPTGEAVITPGFKLKAKYIVHAVGPIWQGGSHNEGQLLYRCYQNAMKVAYTKGCRSIAFPLISSGIYGYPVKDAWRVAIKDDFAVSFPHDSLLLKAPPALGLHNNCLTLLINQGQHRIMGQGDSVSVLTRAKVWKMREYWMYFPFFILHDWGKRSAEARSSHLSGVAQENSI